MYIMESPRLESMWKKIKAKLGLNIPIVLLMFKYAFPELGFPQVMKPLLTPYNPILN